MNPIIKPSSSTFVKPSGDLETSKFILVGEQPGRSEVIAGKPFIGPSGVLLNECLTSTGISRAECYATNFIKDFDGPLKNYIIYNRGTTSLSEKGLYYLDELRTELSPFCKGKVIIAIGGAALYALTGRTGIEKWRGSILTSPDFPGAYIVPCFHPDTVLPPKLVFTNKLLIKFDLKKAKRISDGNYTPLKRNLIIAPTYQQACMYIDMMHEIGLSGEFISFDIEIYNEEVSCISLSYTMTEAMSIPFVHGQGEDYFTPSQEVGIWKKIAALLEDESIAKLGQNVSFDAHFLLRKYGIKSANLHDTMIAQQIIMPDYPKGLDFITSIWTDHPYYKDEGKKYFGGGGWRELWAYNATDSIICTEAFPEQEVEIRHQGNDATYERQRLLIPPLVYMQEHGIRVDLEGIKNRREELEQEYDNLQEELNQAAGMMLNPNSSKQLIAYFYGAAGRGLKPYKSRISGNASVDNNALKRLKRRGFREADIIMKMRKCKKLASTYLNPSKFDEDGRIRCSYNPVGTRYSRISSSSNIFGTGMNLQNWPHELHQFLKPDEGYVFYSFDEAQAENRIVAYVGNITPMIEAFENGIDMHSLTAALIFQKDISQVTREDGSCSLGDGTHSERFWGKKANHGLNYDLGYKTFAFYYEIPEREASFIVNRYHAAYPGVRNNFHTLVRRMLRETRSITNLMGRKTLFLGALDDKTFKEAYSCIPQGTIGDLINERGVEFIYYNPHWFKYVELLDQVHDSVGFQLPLSLPWIEHARILIRIRKNLEQPLRTNLHEFVIPADLTMNPNSFHKESGVEFKGGPKAINDPVLLAQKLEEAYLKLAA